MSRPAPHLLHVLPGFGTGGVQTVLCRVLNGLGTAFRHTILSLGDDLSAAGRLGSALDVDVRRAPASAIGPLAIAERRALIAAIDPAIVLTTNWGSIDWLLANGLGPMRRHVHQEHGFGPDEADFQHARRVWTRRLALRRASRLVVPSRTLAALARRSWWLPESKVELIANGVDQAELLAQARQAPPVKLPDAGPLIATVAPLRREKRLDRLLTAFAAVDPALCAGLVLVGDGPERVALEAQARDLGIARSVIFAGNQSEPARILGRADVYAITSDTEQLPAAVLEAMAVGLPVAGTAVGDVPSMVDPLGRDLLVARADSAGLVSALERLLRDPPLRGRLGAANRTRQAALFDASTMVDRYGKLLTMLLEQGTR